MTHPGYILLEDGTRFDGDLCGAVTNGIRADLLQPGLGEVVFNTSMSGYQEAVTDPSYAGQIVVFNYPLIRHYGVSQEAIERERVHSEPPMTGADFARTVTPSEPIILDPDNPGPRVVAIDTGIKTSIVSNLRQRGVRLELYPASVTAEQLLERDPDAVFLANGPGDPAALDYVVESVRGVVGKVPVFGICMGHQLLCRAIGLDTFKLPFGHRGANHPVKDLQTGKIDITSQNHGFAVQGPAGEGR